jgi:hypothetical protein
MQHKTEITEYFRRKLLNTSGEAEGQAGMEALRVALNC